MAAPGVAARAPSCTALDASPLRPSGDVAVGEALVQRVKEAQAAADLSVVWPMTHGQVSLVMLGMIQAVRGMSWYYGILPFYAVMGMHCLSVTSDIGSLACCLPLFVLGVRGHVVRWACLGPIVSMVFAMFVVDVGGLISYLIVAPPHALPPAWRSFFERAQATAGVWELLLLASVASQLALLLNAWRIYRVLRLLGLYPPGNSLLAKGTKVPEVSMLEVICEAEDIALLSEYGAKCNCSAPPARESTAPASAETSQA
eukprot:TRINITY_DN27598_c0_g2_i1.p1 TRINITY_DN27598_c0_g2~~TRINITY_DN27598_c0_g2_i1.p1  ORF type:complete len:258 (-),score=37.12 TRINITY_DN27598_c0_g2_i1:283-1056(-)